MSADFFRFPHTPHIEWLGEGSPRGDKLLPVPLVEKMLESNLTIEEKVDGANVGFSLDAGGKLRAQNRGAWIDRQAGGQFKHLWSWLRRLERDLEDVLGQNLMLFGEWCYACHSLPYAELPDWFIGFDVYDRAEKKFYSVAKRNKLLELSGIEVIKPVSTGNFSKSELIELLDKPSFYGSDRLEGLYLRLDEGDWLRQRAKLVRSDFTQAIGEHWVRKGIVANQVAGLNYR